MHTPLRFRLFAAAASMLVTFSLLSAVADLAKPPVANVLLAQAAGVIVR